MNRNKFIFILLIALTALCVLMTQPGVLAAAPADDLTVCRTNDVAWTRFLFAYTGTDVVDSWGYGAEGASGGLRGLIADAYYLDPLDPYFGTAFFFVVINGNYYTITGDATTTDCPGIDEDRGSGQPDGGLETITIEVGKGCFSWEFKDDYDNWSVVAVNGAQVFTQTQTEGEFTFVRLVLGQDNPVIDPDRYRLVFVGDTCDNL